MEVGGSAAWLLTFPPMLQHVQLTLPRPLNFSTVPIQGRKHVQYNLTELTRTHIKALIILPGTDMPNIHSLSGV